MPNTFKREKLERGQFTFRRNQDKKDIYMLSTTHKAEAVDTGKKNRKGESIMKPKAIHDYNQNMGGVDKNDAMIGNYSCIRKTYKWYTKVFFIISWRRVFSMPLSSTRKMLLIGEPKKKSIQQHHLTG